MFNRFPFRIDLRAATGRRNTRVTPHRSRQRRRRLRLEQLEARLPLTGALELGAISGRVFADASGDGFTPGEEIPAVTLTLHRDNGDGVFDPAVDTQVDSTTSGDDGRYRFDQLAAGAYFVHQGAQTVGGSSLSAITSELITITAEDADGQLLTVIDTFNAGTQSAVDTTNDGVPVTSSVGGPASEIIGGSRDILVNKLSQAGRVEISVHDPNLPGVISFDSVQTGTGTRIVQWDGPDNDALSLDDSGLGEVDLTSGGVATGLRLEAGANASDATATVRIYTDDGNTETATRFSTGVIEIPEYGPNSSLSTRFLPFSSFIATSGGGADFTRVGAIELEITGAANVSGQANLVGAVGPFEQTFDFANAPSVNLALALESDQTTVGVGDEVVLTLTLSNAGPSQASGIEVAVPLPSGTALVEAAPSQGTLVGGVWSPGALASGAEATLVRQVRIDVAGQSQFTADVTAVDQDTPAGVPPVSVSITAESANLSLGLGVDDPRPNLGDTIEFTLTLNNAGPSTATGVQVESRLPEGLTLRGATPSAGTYDAAAGLWSLPSLAASSSATLRIEALVETAQSRTLTAAVTAADQPDPDGPEAVSVTVTTRSADLSLTNIVDNPTANVGQTVRFTIQVNNAGPDAATGVEVRSLLPTGLTFVEASPTQGNYNPGTGRWTIGSINPGSGATLLLDATIATPGEKSLTAEVVASDQVDPNSTPGNNVEEEDDQQTVVVTPPVIDLSLQMQADKTRVNVSDTINFTLTLANAGPNTATAISIRNALPEGLDFVSSNASVGSYSPDTSLWTLSSLAPGATATLQIAARYVQPITLSNVAEVFAVDQFDSSSTPNNNVPTENDQDSVTIEPLTADLSLAMGVSEATPNLGQDVTLTIDVTNAGPDPATGVSVTATLPDGLAFVLATPSRGTYSAATGVWTIPGEIASGDSQTLAIVAQTTLAEEITVTAEVLTADQFDPSSTPGNNEPGENDQDSVLVTPQLIDLSLSSTLSPVAPNVGQTATYVLTLANAGPSTATGVAVRVTLPELVELESAAPLTGSFNLTTGIWTPAPLAAEATTRLTLIARVTEPGSGTITAEVMAADQPDVDSTPGNQDPSEDDFTTLTFATPVADLSLSKSVDNPTPDRNDLISFTVVVTNSGPDDASGIVVANRTPADFNFVGTPSVTAGTFTPGSGNWSIPALASGDTATLTFSGRVTRLTPVTSVAEIMQADQFDPDSTPGNANPDEDDFAAVQITPNVIDLSVTGRIDNLAPRVGDAVTLTYTVTNDGPATASGVELGLAIPLGVLVLDSETTRGAFDEATGRWVVGTLAPLQTETLTVEMRVTAAGIKRATLQVMEADQFDIDSTPGNDFESEDDQVTVIINAPRVLSKRLFLAR